MFKKPIIIILLLLIIPSGAVAEPRLRPNAWGSPVIGTNVKNLYQVDKGIYRSGQPGTNNIADLEKLGIRQILSLRNHHNDEDVMGVSNGAPFILDKVKMNASNVTEDQLIASLKIIMNRKGPILVHCWHGSDRTGATIAAYRIVFDNWSKSQALDEMINGGYGYHESVFPNLVPLIENLNVARMKKALGIKLDAVTGK